jgi:hypothetical protein
MLNRYNKKKKGKFGQKNGKKFSQPLHILSGSWISGLGMVWGEGEFEGKE